MPNQILTILFFFSITFGFGYALTRFLPSGGVVTLISRIGIGLGAWVALGVLLNFLHIPLDWRIFLAIALVPIVWDCLQKRIPFSWTPGIPKRDLALLLLIFAFCLYIYTVGPFHYPWLEDDDSWAHAAGIKFISVEKNLNAPAGEFHYINPYPPGYDLILGVLHQTSPSIYWTLKFFNGFIISLGYLFFYAFAKEFTRSEKKALLATFFLAAIPCYLTHFIWAHSLAVTLFFPTLYCLSKTIEERRFILPAGVVMAGIFLTTPTKSIKFVVFVLLWILAFNLINKKVWKNAILSLLFGGMLSLLWWGPVFQGLIEKKSAILIRDLNQIYHKKVDPLSLAESIFSPKGGTATRSYTFDDYFHTFPDEDNNLINCHFGLGEVLLALSLLGFILLLCRLKKREKNERIFALTTIFWLIFTFLGMNSQTFNLPVGLFAFRFWILFSIPIVFLATETLYQAITWIKQPLVKAILSIAIIAGVIVTSAHPKAYLNTGLWTPGIYWGSRHELLGYYTLKHSVKANTKVFSFTDNLLVIGYDMHTDFWSDKYKKSFQTAINLPLENLHEALKDNQFEYLIISERDFVKHGKDFMDAKLKAFLQHNLYKVEYMYKDVFWLIKVL